MVTAVVVSDIHDLFLCAGDLCGILGWNDWVVETMRDQCDHVLMGTKRG